MSLTLKPNGDGSVEFQRNGATVLTIGADGKLLAAVPPAAGDVAGMVATLGNTLGNGRTWQNVTASRALGTTYTNTSGRTIGIAVKGTLNANNGGISIVSAGTVLSAMDAPTTGFNVSASAVIPHGSPYVVGGTNLTGLVWSEL